VTGLDRDGTQVVRCSVERLVRVVGLGGVVRGRACRPTVVDQLAARASGLVLRRFRAAPSTSAAASQAGSRCIPALMNRRGQHVCRPPPSLGRGSLLEWRGSSPGCSGSTRSFVRSAPLACVTSEGGVGLRSTPNGVCGTCRHRANGSPGSVGGCVRASCQAPSKRAATWLGFIADAGRSWMFRVSVDSAVSEGGTRAGRLPKRFWRASRSRSSGCGRSLLSIPPLNSPHGGWRRESAV